MGFRSTMITGQNGLDIPEWFVEKYEEDFNFYKRSSGEYQTPISSKCEMKTYFPLYKEFIDDLFILVKDQGIDLSLVFLHECDGITKVDITSKGIVCGEPTGWKITGTGLENGVTHNYCYGCSKLEVL